MSNLRTIAGLAGAAVAAATAPHNIDASATNVVWSGYYGNAQSTGCGAFAGPQGSSVNVVANNTWATSPYTSPSNACIDQEGTIYVLNFLQNSGGGNSYRPQVFALDGATGKQVWVNTLDDYNIDSTAYSLPLKLSPQGILYASFAFTSLQSPTWILLGLDIATGDITWTFSAVNNTMAAYALSPDGLAVYAYFSNGSLTVFETSTGLPQVNYPCYLPARGGISQRADITAHPTGDIIYLNSQRSTIAVEMQFGNTLWNVTNLDDFVDHPAVIDPQGTRAYLATANGFTAVDAITGAQRWQVNWPVPNGVTVQSVPGVALATATNTLFALASTDDYAGMVFAFNALTGAVLGSATVTGDVGSHLIASPDGSMVYLAPYTSKSNLLVGMTFNNATGPTGGFATTFNTTVDTNLAEFSLALGPYSDQLTLVTSIAMSVYQG